jgi:hypothetical protein
MDLGNVMTLYKFQAIAKVSLARLADQPPILCLTRGVALAKAQLFTTLFKLLPEPLEL